MGWLHFNTRIPNTVQKDPLATTLEMQATFDAERENLYWIAFVITGDSLQAERSIIDASGLQKTNSGVFRDWLTRWAHSATARVAARGMRAAIDASAQTYSDKVCGHSDHELLSADQVAFIRELDPKQIIVNLDPLARSILVLRGIQRASISDCALLLDVPRRSVIGAYCHTLNWLQSNRGSEPATSATSLGFNKIHE